MIWIDLIFVFLFALILSGILAWGFGWRHPAAADAVAVSMGFLFVILLLTMWAGLAWLPPWGPVWYGTPWLGILLVGVLISLLLLAAATPARRPLPSTPEAEAEEAREEAVTATAFGVFFWILILGLIIAIGVSYFA